MNNNEITLVEKVKQGDALAFGELYDEYVKKIYNYIYFRTYHKETAEDLTSLTFTKAYEKIDSFANSKGNFSSWLYRIARNTVIDHYRTNKSTSDIFEAYDLSARENIETDFDVKDSLEKVQAYLKQLNPDQRELVILRVWDGLSYREIAEITGKTEDSLKVAFSRIMSKMRKETVLAVLTLLIINQMYN
jgi:RNA polymerase sigma-70 factor, ECF subfamily